jgi:Carboxypeptidase regulatory-like domain
VKRATQTVSAPPVLFLALSMPVAWAQESRATMSGRGADPQGAVVPDAQVAVRADATGVEQTTKTNGQGNWTVRFLTPGNYSLRVTAPGFKQVERHKIALQTADQKQLDIQLDTS